MKCIVPCVAIYVKLIISVASFETVSEKGECSSPFGLSSKIIPDSALSSPVPDSTAESGRLGNPEGAWCFTNSSVFERSAAFLVDLGNLRFVSGIVSQGPPASLKPVTYNHVVGFSLSISNDGQQWKESNGGNLFFSVDKEEASDAVNNHAASSIDLGRYVKVNVTMLVSGLDIICLRFEIYGCDTNVEPYVHLDAKTTTTGRIQVRWSDPSAENSIGLDIESSGVFFPDRYLVRYRPLDGETTDAVTDNRKEMLLEDVRLGATYDIEIHCDFGSIFLQCGDTQIEAYPPCPPHWTGGNEYHCFLLMALRDDDSFSETRGKCLDDSVDESLGSAGGLIDNEEQLFLTGRILPEDARRLWIIGDKCALNGDCCELAQVNADGTLEISSCGENMPKWAVCIRDHKGEGARLRASRVSSLDAGSSAMIQWHYEGDGWKTDELQIKLWSEDSAIEPSVFTFSTLEGQFVLHNLKKDVMYQFLLRPAPNIRSLEKVNNFIIMEIPRSSEYGALMTPTNIWTYVLWQGKLKVLWNEAEVVSGIEPQVVGRAERYVVNARETADPEVIHRAEISTSVEDKTFEYSMSPVAMGSEYKLEIKCYFFDVSYPCSEVLIRTDPPNLVRKSETSTFVYERLSEHPSDWSNAERECASRTGHLVSVLDEQEAKELLTTFPNKNAVFWTGAKLGRKATGYWTDGTKITDLLMAKTSGVTSSTESCCRAVNEAGRLRLSGAACTEQIPYICKYRLENPLGEIHSVSASVTSWKSVDVSWKSPSDRWLPSYVEVSVCPSTETSSDLEELVSCQAEGGVRVNHRINLVSFDKLDEFRAYDVSIQASLEAFEETFTKTLRVVTYPKEPIWYNITSEGMMTVQAVKLMAIGHAEAKINAIVTDKVTDDSLTVSGAAALLSLSKLVLDRRYSLEISCDDGIQWSQNLEFDAVPTCVRGDARRDNVCYKITKAMFDFPSAYTACEDRNSRLWVPKQQSELTELSSLFPEENGFWFDSNQLEKNVLAENVADCAQIEQGKCCFYDRGSDIICTCCSEKKTLVCTYTVEPILGKVVDLYTSSSSPTTMEVIWSPPQTFWNILAYEVQWGLSNAPQERTLSQRTEYCCNITLKDLQPASNYILSVRALSLPKYSGEAVTGLGNTLDPNPPLKVFITDNGFYNVRSPRLVAKGRGTQDVKIQVFEKGRNSDPVLEVKGQAQNSTFSGLKLDENYQVKITSDQDLDHAEDISSSPTCHDGQTQNDQRCIWIPEGSSKTWAEAAKMCQKLEGGRILSSSRVEDLVTDCSLLRKSFKQSAWINVTSSDMEKQKQTRGCGSSNEVSDQNICCYCELEVLDVVSCGCCAETKSFMCQTTREVDFGKVGKVTIEDITSNSVQLSWEVVKPSGWDESSFLVFYEQANKKSSPLSTERLKVTSLVPKAEIRGLNPSSSYRLTVSTAHRDEPRGDAMEIVVTTMDEGVMLAGLQNFQCPLIILKITCCCAVILGTSVTVFAFLIARMFYLDCLAHICSELALMCVYLCILIASAQSHSTDNECSQADLTLCTATAVLIQFLFQVTFLFLFLESLILASQISQDQKVLRTISSYIASSQASVLFCGWGIPAIILITSAAVASDDFTNGNRNCWLNISGKALLPSVIPIGIFISLNLCVLVPFVCHYSINPAIQDHCQRISAFPRMLRISFVLLFLIAVSWLSGMLGSADKTSFFNYVFIAFSFAMALAIPLLRIRQEKEVYDLIKRAVFGTSTVRPITTSSGRRSSVLETWTELWQRKQLMKTEELAQLATSNGDNQGTTALHR